MAKHTKVVGRKGEVVIPQDIRKQQGITPNTKVEFISTNSGILLVPLNKKISDFRGMFGKTGVKDMKKLDILAQELMYRM